MRATALLLLAASAVSTVLALNCSIQAIDSLLPSNAHTLSATKVPQNGSFGQGADDIPYPINPSGLPSLCAVIVNATSSNTSSFTFGLFLPDDWNKRFLAVGNGGFAGGINWLAMGDGAQYGFATVSTDTGHNGTFLDMSFALDSPEKKTDWGYRAMHNSIIMAKDIVKGFYGTKAKYSYYSGCSTGGRQGMKEVQDYPEDFDGVLAGAPSWWTTHQQTWQLQIGLINLPENSSHYIPHSLFQYISDTVLAQCDAVDGIKDGIIMNPKRCDPYFEAMLCKSGNPASTNATNCLTAAQLNTLYQLYSPLKYDTNVFDYPNFGLGSEAQMPSSFGDEGSNAPSLYGTEYVKYMVVNDVSWDYKTFTSDIIHQADATNPGNANANKFNISAFHARGGKLLHYHGYADGLIPTDASIQLYKNILYNMTTQGVQDIDDWYRFFLVPGMQHCGGSVYDAPWFFGGSGHGADLVPSRAANTIEGLRDAEHDALLALMRWVENGTAPDRLVATKFKNDTVELGVQRQRPICPFPNEAKWTGEGDKNNAESWKCVARDEL